jgi:hypothetical protein
MAQPVSNLIRSLSPHLFWDVDIAALDAENDQAFIIHRVLEYGLMTDWTAIVATYGIARISQVATTCRSLDKKAAAFVSCVADIPREQFRCFEQTPSKIPYWNF